MMTHRISRALSGLFVVSIFTSLIATFGPVQPVFAIDCNGTLDPEDCLLEDVGTISGNYQSVLGGDGIYEDNSFGSTTITVPDCVGGPATIAQATLSWAIRDSDAVYWEDGVDLSVDAGPTVGVTHDRRYKSFAQTRYYSSYSADITAQVLAGTHTYDVTNIDTSGTADFTTTQWGFGIHVVYECPEFELVDVNQKDGLDLAWRGFSEAYAIDRTELMCEDIVPDVFARTAAVDVFLPGAAAPSREADIWYKTGTGSAPSPTDYDLLTDVNTGANGGIDLERLVLTSDDPEWDSYQNTAVNIPAGAEYVCFQVDSSFDVGEHPDDVGASGASMFAGGMWITVPQASTLSLGNYVWNDSNNNGVIDGSEDGICGVTVHLYADVGGDEKYDSGVEGVVPDDVTTTACGANDGEYLFAGLAPGDYIVVIPQSELDDGGTLDGYISSTGTNGSATGAYEPAADPDNNINSDDNGFMQEGDGIVSCAVTLANVTEPITDGDTNANTNLSVDFGVFNQAKLGDFVWYDLDGNGVQDSGEEGVEGVTATLYNAADDSQVAVLVTDAAGAYQFCYLVAGSYYVEFSDLPEGYFLTVNDGDDEATDSDVIPNTSRTEVFTLAEGEVLADVDGGIQQVLGDLSETPADDPDELAETGAGAYSIGAGLILLIAAIAAIRMRSMVPYAARQAKSVRGNRL